MKRNIVVSLFDLTGEVVKPWRDAGYECWIVDTQHPEAYPNGGVTFEDGIHKVHYDLSRSWLPPFNKDRIAFAAAAPPCTHVAVSGSKWFKGKGLRLLASSVNLFATAAEFCEWSKAPYFIENPITTMATYWRKPDYYFSPDQFTGLFAGDNYTKETSLWTGGGFVMPEEFKAGGLGKPDDRIHKCPPGKDRANIRSAMPRGFSLAVFLANNITGEGQ